MKKFKSFLTIAAIVIISAFGIKKQHIGTDYTSEAIANIEALSTPEGETGGGLDTSYQRATKDCKFYVGAFAEVKVLGIGLVKADGDGYIFIPEQVTCIANGNETCSPVECIDILRLIVSTEQG